MIAWNCYRSKVFKFFIGCIFHSRRSSMQGEVQQTPAVYALHQIASDIQRTPYRLTVTSSIRNEEKTGRNRGGIALYSHSKYGNYGAGSPYFNSFFLLQWKRDALFPLGATELCTARRQHMFDAAIPPLPPKERSIMRNLTQVEGTHGRHSIIPLWCVSSEKSNPSIKRNK